MTDYTCPTGHDWDIDQLVDDGIPCRRCGASWVHGAAPDGPCIPKRDKPKEQADTSKKNDGEIGWKYLEQIMSSLPEQFRSPDLSNTAQKVREYLSARPWDRRASDERRRTEAEKEAEAEAFLDAMGLTVTEQAGPGLSERARSSFGELRRAAEGELAKYPVTKQPMRLVLSRAMELSCLGEEAADALEALEAENVRLLRKILQNTASDFKAGAESAQARIAQLEGALRKIADKPIQATSMADAKVLANMALYTPRTFGVEEGQ